MESQETANRMTEPASGHGETTVKPNAPLPPQGFQARPQGPPPSPRNSINNGPVGAPQPGQPLLRRLDSRSSLGPPGPGQFVQLRPYGPPRPPGGTFPPRPQQPGQLPPQNPLHPSNQRFAYPPGIRGPPPPSQAGGQRPPYVGNVHQAYQAQQQPRGINDPRFQRPPPDIAPQNGPPRIAEAPPQRPGQESAHPRQLLRNDSSLSLQRQHLSSNEEIKQPRRPRIVIEKMENINESSSDVNKTEGYLRTKRSEVRQNSENDDDDDVVMDSKKSPRHDAVGSPDGLMNGSKSPLTPRRLDDAGRPASQPGTAATEHKLEKIEDKQDAPSRPLSVNTDDKARKDDPTLTVSQGGFPSAINNEKEERTEDAGVKSPPVDDLKSDRTSRPPSTMSISEPSEEMKKPNSPYRNDTPGSIDRSLKTPARSSDNSRSSTPSRLDVPLDAEQEPKTPSKTPDKSRSSTPSHLETPRNAEQEPRTPSKNPDKSRSSTPAGLESYEHAEQESRTPIKTPDKSRSSTPAGLEPPGNAERETRSPSKTPDKSRTSTPAELAPSPNAEKEQDAPAITPDKSRSVTPAGIESSNSEVEKPAENLHRDRSGESTPQMKQSSRPPSSLGSPNAIIGRGSKSPKSPRSPTVPENQDKLSVPGSMITPPKSPDEGVKGFDNGRQRSLSPRMSPAGSPRPSNSPRSSAGSAKQAEAEKKRTSFVEDPAAMKKATEVTNKIPTPTATSPSKPTTPTAETRRAEKPTKLIDEKAEQKSSQRKAIQNGSTNDTQANAVPTTNGVAESPTKKSPSKSKESDKRSTAGSPTKSPSKSAKSLPRTPETPPSTAQEKKKVPMNKVQVGAAPSPNLKTVRSKIGSLENTSYKPGGGKVKIENRKLDFSKAQPKIAAKNEKYTPSGGDKKISQVKLQWNAKSKVGSLDNATYKPGGGDKKIETVKLDFKDKAKPKVGSKDNTKHVPGGGAVKSATPPKTPQEAKNNIPMQKIDIKAESKIGSLDNMKHKPGGGDKKIFNDRDYLRQTSSNVESLNGSGSQAQTPVDDDRRLPKDLKISDVEVSQPQPPPSTPTRARHVTSPSAAVTPRAVRSGLTRSPEATTPRRQLTQETDEQSLADGSASKTPSPDVTDDRNMPKSRSPRPPISPRPPSSLRVKSASDRSSPGTPRKTSPSTPTKTSPRTPRKTSPKELRLPKLASSPIPHEASPASESHSKISLPKLIEPSSQSARMAY